MTCTDDIFGKDRVRCSLCGRKMQPATIRNHVYYRCEFKDQEAALYPNLTHPRTVNLREDIVCHALDPWIARAFAPDRLTATIEALTLASAAASATETHTPKQAQARQTIKDCERRLARYQAALEAGADPAVVTQWINDAQRDKEAAQAKLDALPTVARKKEPPLNAQQIRQITESLGDIAQRIHTASSDKKAHSTKPSASPSATNTQRGPRPLGRGPRHRIVSGCVRGGI